MGARFVEVDPEAVRALLRSSGFVLDERAGFREEVWERVHARISAYRVRVFTTIDPRGTRGCGQDAMRVVAIGGGKCVYKGKRVYRTGSQEKVLGRLLERMREAYGAINEELKRERAR